MIFKAFVIATSLALEAAGNSVAAPCAPGETPCGDMCIPSSRTCCKLIASFGTVHAACPLEWHCETDETCLPLRQDQGGVPLCPEGLTACGAKCVSAREVCCNDGAYACPEGNVCAPPPLNCAVPASTVPAEEPTLETPRDQQRPTAPPGFTLPGPLETTILGTQEQTASGSAASQSDEASHTETSGPLETSTAKTASDFTSSSDSLAPAESDPAEDKAAPAQPSVLLAWVVSVIIIVFS